MLLSAEDLRQRLCRAYDRTSWLELVSVVFPAVSVLRTPQEIPVVNPAVRRFHQLGTVRLNDGRNLALFEVEVADSVAIGRNRVALRNVIAGLIDQEQHHGVLGIFNSNGGEYRFTFAARETFFSDDGEYVERETAPKRYTYVLGQREVCTTAARRFAELAGRKETAGIKDVVEAFSLERLNREFFQQVQSFFIRLVGGTVDGRTVEGMLRLPGSVNGDAVIRQEFAVRLIGRILFGWFLKQKRTVADRPLIPDSLLSSDAAQTDGYFHKVLEKLFFQVLNRPMEERIQHLPGGSHLVPFLNGGLFEPHARDYYELGEVGMSKHVGTMNVADDWFRGFFSVLEQYNFTIDENVADDADISIDPEILGRIFENLLAEINPETGETARKATGSFYTPRNIVAYMVEESLLAFLENAPDVQSVENPPSNEELRSLFDEAGETTDLGRDARRAVVRALGRVKVLDPACGSGAFPVGMLQKMLCALRKVDPGNDMWIDAQFDRVRGLKLTKQEEDAWLAELEHAFETNAADYGRKLGIIQNSIYGIDIQPIAVEIAKLRFFLTLVVDETIHDDEPNRGVLPLPNLDFKFVCANTLVHAPELDAPDPNNALGLRFEDTFFAEFAEASRDYFYARKPADKSALRKRIEEIIGGKVHEKSEAVFSLVSHGDERASAALRQKHQAKISTLVRDGELWRSFGSLFKDQPVGFFEPRYMFPDTVTGFDIVIGNPPYVRQERIKAQKPLFKEQYGEDFTSTADLYVYFFLRSLELLRPGGFLCFITSNKYFRAGYGKKLRSKLASDTSLRILADFGDAPVFAAIAYPSIILTAKREGHAAEADAFRALPWSPELPVADFANVFEERSFAMPQADLGIDGWRLEKPEVLRRLAHMRAAGTPLGDYVQGRFFYGIKTGLNEAFVIDRATRDSLIAQDPGSADIIKPFLRGRDVKRWRVQFADQYLIKIESSENVTHPWTDAADPETTFAETFPAIYRWFEPLRDRMIARCDQGRHWWELRACAYWQEFEKPKIILGRFMNSPVFACDSHGYFHNDALYMIPHEHASFLAAVLNSECGWWFLTQICTDLQNGYLQAYRGNLFGVPIPAAAPARQAEIEALVDQILAAKAADPMADVSAFESTIDEAVESLFADG